MVAFFRQITGRRAAARRITPVLDSTTYNRAAVVHGRVDQPGCQVRAVHLPPHAPNLNLIGRLWRFFEQKTLWDIR